MLFGVNALGDSSDSCDRLRESVLCDGEISTGFTSSCVSPNLSSGIGDGPDFAHGSSSSRDSSKESDDVREDAEDCDRRWLWVVAVDEVIVVETELVDILVVCRTFISARETVVRPEIGIDGGESTGDACAGVCGREPDGAPGARSSPTAMSRTPSLRAALAAETAACVLDAEAADESARLGDVCVE